MAWHESFRAVLRRRNPRLLFGASTISAFGDWIYLVALAELTLEVGGVAALTALTAVRYGAGIAFAPIGGMLADRFPRRALMIAADLVSAAAMFLLALISGSRAGGVGAVLALSTASALARVVFRAARPSLLPHTVEKDELLALNTILGTVNAFAFSVAPALGGLLLLALDRKIAFALNGASFVLAAVLVALVTVKGAPAAASPSKSEPARLGWFDGFGHIGRNRVVLVVTALIFLNHVGAGAVWVLFPLMGKEILHGGGSGIGYLTSAIGIGCLMGMLAGGIFGRRNKLRTSIIGIALYGCALCMTALPSSWLVAGAAALLIGVFDNISEAPMWTLLHEEIADEARGRVYALIDALGIVGLLMGSALFGVLVELGGARLGSIALGGMVAVGCIAVGFVAAQSEAPSLSKEKVG